MSIAARPYCSCGGGAHPGLRDARLEWLARHYTEAGQAGQAATLWLEAGRRAKATFATSEAASHFVNCLRAAAAAEGSGVGPPELHRVQAEALVTLGDLASLSEDLVAADEHYRAAIEMAPEADPAAPDREQAASSEDGHAGRRPDRLPRARVGPDHAAVREHAGGGPRDLPADPRAPVRRVQDRHRRPARFRPLGPLARPYPLSEHAADVRAIAALDTPRLVGVGISMGANLLFRIAHAAPGLLRGIVTIGGPTAGHRRPFFPDDWLHLQQETGRTLEVEPMLQLHIRHVFSEPEMREMLDAIVRTRLTLPRETLLSFFLDDLEDDVTPLLPTIATPTLVTHGGDDRLVSFGAAELAASSLRTARSMGSRARDTCPSLRRPTSFAQSFALLFAARNGMPCPLEHDRGDRGPNRERRTPPRSPPLIWK